MTDPTNPEPSAFRPAAECPACGSTLIAYVMLSANRSGFQRCRACGAFCPIVNGSATGWDVPTGGRAFERSQAKEPAADVRCSFCEKTTREICQMIAGKSDARICDECVQVAVEIVLTTQRKQIMDAGKEAVRIPPVGEKGKGE
jgi:hypothetical protein